MRYLLSAIALTLATTPALAGGAEEFFMGRPPSVGVVQGGAFGVGGSDYLGEERGRPYAATRPPRTAPRVAHVGRVRRDDAPAVVARPYYRP